jgi:hypothetical protein
VATHSRSDRVGPCRAGSDLYCVLDVLDKDLAVARLAGVGGFSQRVDHVSGRDIGDRTLEFDLLMEVDRVRLAAPRLGLAGWLPRPETSLTVSDGAPTSARASFAAPSFSGRMIATTSLMPSSFGASSFGVPPSVRIG